MPQRTVLPIEAIRDAMGLVRGLDAIAKDEGHHGRVVATEEAGAALKDALTLAVLDPDTIGCRAAPGHVERAFAALERMPWPEGVVLLIRVAKARATRAAQADVSPPKRRSA
jgi:hypothetical protein